MYSRRTPVKRQLKRVTHKLTRVAKVVDATTGKKTARLISLSTLTSAFGQCKFGTVAYVQTDVRDFIDSIQFVDKAGDPSVRTFYNGNVGVYQREFYFPDGVSSKYTMRNLNQQDVLLRAYIVVPKEATAFTPEAAFIQGLPFVTNTPSAELHPGVYLTDSPLFNELYKIVATKKTVLAPGQECTMRYTSPPFTYDPKIFDALTTETQVNPEWGAHFLIKQIQGRMVFSNLNVGLFAIGPAQIYTQHTVVQKMTYDAGGAIEQLDLPNVSQSTFPPADVRQTSKPGVQVETFITT